MALDLEGVMVSAGSACSSGKVKPSGVLEAMGFGAAGPRRPARLRRLVHHRGRLGALRRRLARRLRAAPRPPPRPPTEEFA